MTSFSQSDSANSQTALGLALQDIKGLVAHLASSLMSSGSPILPVFPDTLSQFSVQERKKAFRDFVEYALELIPTAEIVLWRNDLLKYARAQADKFDKHIVQYNDIPRSTELWYPYSERRELMEDKTSIPDTIETITYEIDGIQYALIFDLLAPTFVDSGPNLGKRCLIWIGFLYPVVNGKTIQTEPPRLHFGQLLTEGEPPKERIGLKLLSSLTFRASPFLSDEKIEQKINRAERRRMERADVQPSTVRIVNLRRKEPTNQAGDANSHMPASQYNWQWFVKPHARKPNARMKEQRVTWVNGYIKGPAGKPLKPLTLNVKVVKR